MDEKVLYQVRKVARSYGVSTQNYVRK